MTDEKKEGVRDTYGQRPGPSLMGLRYTLAREEMDSLVGPYKDQWGVEHCATQNFEWVGRALPGETWFQIFDIDDLQPAD